MRGHARLVAVICACGALAGCGNSSRASSADRSPSSSGSSPAASISVGSGTPDGAASPSQSAGSSAVRHAIPGTDLTFLLPADYRVAASISLGAALPAAFADEAGIQALYATGKADALRSLRLIASDPDGSEIVILAYQFPTSSPSKTALMDGVDSEIAGSGLTYEPDSGRSYLIGSRQVLSAVAHNTTEATEFVDLPSGHSVVSLSLLVPRADEAATVGLRAGIVGSLRPSS